ncbi:hypothetical protein CRG98_031762 [Punica granatum]|uniref:Uncharacterized protein n=1 Tax=Punica granatum TaxID=22663 RepID=A0A2I0IUX2_PUNGR|nr:hypothetical protein CRG98_031762 [Punica granatum]
MAKALNIIQLSLSSQVLWEKFLMDRLYLKQRLYKLRLSPRTSIESHESFVDTVLYGRAIIALEDVKVSLNLKKLQKKVIDNQGGMVRDLSQQADRLRRGLVAGASQDAEKGLAGFATRNAISSGAVKGEKHVPGIRKNLISLGCLNAFGYKYRGQGRVLKVSKGDLAVMKGVLQDGIYVLQGTWVISALTRWMGEGHCTRSVEKSVKKVDFAAEDPKTPETQPVVVEDVQMGRSEGRQHSLWNSLRTRDKQKEHLDRGIVSGLRSWCS